MGDRSYKTRPARSPIETLLHVVGMLCKDSYSTYCNASAVYHRACIQPASNYQQHLRIIEPGYYSPLILALVR